MKKYNFFIVVLLIQSFIFCSVITGTHNQTRNSNSKDSNISPKSNSNEEFIKILNETKVNSYTTNHQEDPSICALSNDTIAIAWYGEGQGDTVGVFARVLNTKTGDEIISEFRVNEYTSMAQQYPSICALSSDTFAIAWESAGQEGADSGIYARVFNATTGAEIVSEFHVNNYTTNDQISASICALSSDKMVVAWQSEDQDGSGNGIYASVFNASTGNNVTSEFRVNNYTINHQVITSICALSSDTFAVAWHGEGQSDDHGVYANVFNASTGNNITSEFRVNNYTTNDQVSASICALSSDTFAVSWTSMNQDGSGDGIYASVFNATTGDNITSEFQVNEYTYLSQQYSSICALSNETFAVSWMSWDQDGSYWGIYARVFNATTGDNITSEFRVNEYTNLAQQYPSICALSSDTFAVAWESNGQDTSGWGIYVSIFGPDYEAPRVSIIDPTAGFYNSEPLLINASILDLGTGVASVKAMINATTSFNISMTPGLGDYWSCYWDNISSPSYTSGDYNITMWAIDDAGNINQTESVIITIDKDAPSVSIMDPTAGLYGSAPLLINASILDLGTGVTSVKAMINATTSFNISMTPDLGDYWSCYWDNISSPSYTSGDYNIIIWAIDDAGNINQTESVIITIDKDAPSVSIMDPTAGLYGTAPLLINASILDLGTGVASVKAMINATTSFNISMTLDLGDYWSCYWDNISSPSYTSGDYNITIWTIDDIGNVNQTESVIITIDKDNPSIFNIDPTAGLYGSAPLLINASIIDLGSSVAEAKAMINATTSFNISMTPDLGDYWSCYWDNITSYTNGDYSITIWAIDNAGNINQSESVIITIEFSSPIPPNGGGGSSNGGDRSDNDNQIEENLILILTITLAIVIAISAGGIYSIKKKKSIQEIPAGFKPKLKTLESRRKDLKKSLKTLKEEEFHKGKKSAVSTSSLTTTAVSSGVDREELKKTESEVDVEKMKFMCVVHKGLIEGAMYLCPKCNALYCVRCAKALKEKGEMCWVCESEITID